MVTQHTLRWIISEVRNPRSLAVSFTDGKLVKTVERGGSGVSYRLVVQAGGFLDITSAVIPASTFDTPISVIDFNNHQVAHLGSSDVLHIALDIPGDGTFSASVASTLDTFSPCSRATAVSGLLKPLPIVSDDDAAHIDSMRIQEFLPYPKDPDVPGKTDNELEELGRRLFAWTPHSYALAMCAYDWTTASFVRMVFMKVFEYTSIPESPSPLDLSSIALMIWESRWGSFNPSDPDYMRSFMMKPATSLADVSAQLEEVYVSLHHFSNVQNRILSAALRSLPRTCTLTTPYLFSGQVDVHQMGTQRFGAEFLEFPRNAGPVGQALAVELTTALATFLRPGAVVTTKACMPFTDSEADARTYSNGILLVVRPESDTFVWDAPGYVTPLSNDPGKIEYVFPPGSMFRVLSVEDLEECGGRMHIINMQAVSRTQGKGGVVEGVTPVGTAVLTALDAMRTGAVASEGEEEEELACCVCPYEPPDSERVEANGVPSVNSYRP